MTFRLADVWYDPYKFQDTVFESSDLKEVLNYCEINNIAPFTYKEGDAISDSLKRIKKSHYWIYEL